MKQAETKTRGSLRREDNLSNKMLLFKTSPRQTLELVRRIAWARWSLRTASSVGKYVKLTGRMRVVNRGQMVIGDRVLLYSNVAMTELAVMQGGTLTIGKGAFINYGAEICAHKLIEIGEECRIGTHCIIMDNDFHDLDWRQRDRKPPSEEVVLEPYVWVGNRVTILKGVRIGFGAVVASGSVVTKSIPPMCVAAGVPAKVIKKLEGDSIRTLERSDL